MQRIRVYLSIPADDFLPYYRGEVMHVKARSHEGKIVRFPASVLRRFVTESGIEGEFEIDFTAENRIQDIRRVR